MTPNEIQQLLKEAYLRGIADFKQAVLDEFPGGEYTLQFRDIDAALDRAEEKLTKDI